MFSNTKVLDSNTGFGGERRECARRKAQYRGVRRLMQERQLEGAGLSLWTRWSGTGRWGGGRGLMQEPGGLGSLGSCICSSLSFSLTSG